MGIPRHQAIFASEEKTITQLELSLPADASRGRPEHLSFDGGKFGSQGGPCDPSTKIDAR